MESLLAPSNVMFVLGVLGTMFAIYSYFRNPQIESDKRDIVLAQQVQWAAEATDRRFKEIQEHSTTAMTLAQNHIHTLDTKMDTLNERVGGIESSIVKLSTIIDERIPRK